MTLHLLELSKFVALKYENFGFDCYGTHRTMKRKEGGYFLAGKSTFVQTGQS